MTGLSRHLLMCYASPNEPYLGEPTLRQRAWLLSLSGMVERYHNIPTITRDTVGEHTYGVLWMVVLLSEPDLPSAKLFLAALAHDTPEVNWGDITAPTKRILGIRAEYGKLEAETYRALGVQMDITQAEHRTLKVADCLDAMLHCCYERALGNQMVCEVIGTFKAYLVEMGLSMHENRLMNEVLDIWRTFDEGHR